MRKIKTVFARALTNAAMAMDGLFHLILLFAMKGTPQLRALRADPTGWPKNHRSGCRMAIAIVFGAPLALYIIFLLGSLVLNLPWSALIPKSALSLDQAQIAKRTLSRWAGDATVEASAFWMMVSMPIANGMFPWNWRGCVTAGLAASGREWSGAHACLRADAKVFWAWLKAVLEKGGLIVGQRLCVKAALVLMCVFLFDSWLAQSAPDGMEIKNLLFFRSESGWGTALAGMSLGSLIGQVVVIGMAFVGARAMALRFHRLARNGERKGLMFWRGRLSFFLRTTNLVMGVLLPIAFGVGLCWMAASVVIHAITIAVHTRGLECMDRSKTIDVMEKWASFRERGEFSHRFVRLAVDCGLVGRICADSNCRSRYLGIVYAGQNQHRRRKIAGERGIDCGRSSPSSRRSRELSGNCRASHPCRQPRGSAGCQQKGPSVSASASPALVNAS